MLEAPGMNMLECKFYLLRALFIERSCLHKPRINDALEIQSKIGALKKVCYFDRIHFSVSLHKTCKPNQAEPQKLIPHSQVAHVELHHKSELHLWGKLSWFMRVSGIFFLLLAEPHLTISPSAKHVLGGERDTRIQHQKMCHFSEPRGPSNGHGPGQGGRENATEKLGYFQFERGMCSTWAHSSRWLGKWVEKVNRYVWECRAGNSEGFLLVCREQTE